MSNLARSRSLTVPSPFLCLCLLSVGLLWGCQAPEEAPLPDGPVRLVDLFSVESLENARELVAPGDPIAWQLTDGETDGWSAAVGVDGWNTENGLSGRSTTERPLLHGVFEGTVDDEDLVHALEIRMRASAGTRLQARLTPQDPVWEREINPIFPWPFDVPLIADGESHLYTLPAQGMRPVTGAAVRHLLLNPTDVADADFTIESVRVVLRGEHLASLPSGIGWHGLESQYQETLVSRVGERMRFSVRLPARPRLDWSMGSTDAQSPDFQVSVVVPDGEKQVFSGQPQTPHQWQRASVDLTDYAGQEVELVLQLAGESDGVSDAIGFWGSPVVRQLRNRGLASREGRPAGVVVLLADTLRRDHLDMYGYGRETAPFLTTLAEHGTLVEDAISQATWTKASVPSIFTSMYPATHGVEHFTDRLPAAAETMAEIYRDAGYATLGLSSITFTGRFTNLHQGYEEFHESSSLPPNLNSKGAKHYVDRLLSWLETNQDVPFFVFLHVADPHSPYEAPEPYDTLYGKEGDKEIYIQQQDAARPFIENSLMRAFGMPLREDLEEAGIDPETYVGYELDAYDGSIRGMDDQMLRLMDGLKEMQLLDEVLMAFVSDHGTEFLDHGYHFHGHTVFGELNRVPMFFWGYGVPAGRRITSRVQTLDLMPTVLELSGLPVPAAAQGQSLVPWMQREMLDGLPEGFRERPAVTEKAQHTHGAAPQEGEFMSLAYLVDDWKLVHHMVRPEDRPEFQLFQPSVDPLDQVDLAAEHPDVVQQLAAQLADWRQQALAVRLSDEGLEEGLSAEEMERLRSLGYL